MKRTITIGITRTIASDEKFQKYVDFLRRFDQTANIVVLSQRNDNGAEIDRCDGDGKAHHKLLQCFHTQLLSIAGGRLPGRP